MHPFLGQPSPEVIETVGRLIAFDTTSRNSNLGLIETLRDQLRDLGFRSALTYDATEGKANLLATLPADDGRLNGGICLSGHVDTVPVDGQEWSSDPYSATLRRGRIYGRGACDMKGFVGTAIAVGVARATRPRSSPLHLALSYDEELGCLGAPGLVADMVARGIRPDGCIVGEPTRMEIVSAHKGATVGRVRVRGLAQHSSSAPSGVNAIEHAAGLIVHLRQIADGFAQDGPFDGCFEVPFTTLQTGVINGGIAVNTVPAACELVFEFRNLPDVDPQDIRRTIDEHIAKKMIPAMRQRSAASDADIDWLAGVPAFEADESQPFTRQARAITGDHVVRKVAYGTEAGIFAQAGIPSLVCGPGDIAQAHVADEFVSVEQLARCEGFLTRLIDAF
jgi:acetylornithine deacetylase